MSLPETVRLRISSEAAGAISISPVVVQDMPLRELVDHMLGVTGKDPARLRELLLRGTFVSGASRMRWTGWDASDGVIRQLLTTFPDPDPARPFDAAGCVRAVLRAAAGPPVDLPRDAAVRRSLIRRRSFWNVVIGVAREGSPQYLDYSYKEHADRYRLELTPPLAGRLRDEAGLLTYPGLAQQVRAGAWIEMDLHTRRG
ncbi:MAG: hypothetical protein ACRD44_12030 [Bryobacteraceae bacterium]